LRYFEQMHFHSLISFGGLFLIHQNFCSTFQTGNNQILTKNSLDVGNITCILSDFDGTLANKDHALSDRTVGAISDILKKGYKFFVCTGRTRSSLTRSAPEILAFFKNNPERVAGVYQQGLMVYGPSGELIYEKELQKQAIQETASFCQEHQIGVVAYAGDRIFCRSRCVEIEQTLARYKDPAPEIFPSGLDMLSEVGVKVHKLIMFGEESFLEQKRCYLSERLRENSATITKAIPGMLEVLPYGESKGKGVSILLNHIKVSKSNVMAFGDGENDLEMLQLAKVGVAVQNASPILQGIADFVTLNNYDDGVAAILETLPNLRP